MDTNKDKKLSKTEIADDERLNENLAEIDGNKDGNIELEELRKYYTELFSRGRGFGRGGDRGGRDGDGDGERRPRRPGGDNDRPARPQGNNSDVEL